MITKCELVVEACLKCSSRMLGRLINTPSLFASGRTNIVGRNTAVSAPGIQGSTFGLAMRSSLYPKLYSRAMAVNVYFSWAFMRCICPKTCTSFGMLMNDSVVNGASRPANVILFAAFGFASLPIVHGIPEHPVTNTINTNRANLVTPLEYLKKNSRQIIIRPL